jgi:hypothetical protein
MHLVRRVEDFFSNGAEPAKESWHHPRVSYRREHRCRVSALRLLNVFAFDTIEQLLLQFLRDGCDETDPLFIPEGSVGDPSGYPVRSKYSNVLKPWVISSRA